MPGARTDRVDLTGRAAVALPLALADLHRARPAGSLVHLRLPGAADRPGGEVRHLEDVVAGAGFAAERWTRRGSAHLVAARRERTLPDTVGPAMRALVVGLNPSLYAADAGVGFARPGNRFWPAALAAGLVATDRDPRRALEEDRVGMTDLVKRATVGAREVTSDEYRTGAARLERLVAWLEPAVVCVVGLTGWRTAVDPGARPGPQPASFGGRPTYLMPNTSGLNAHTRLEDFVDHLRAVVGLAGGPDRPER